MLRRHKHALAGMAIATLLAAGTGIGTALARDASSPRQDQDNVAIGAEQIIRVLPLMEQDKSGKIISKEEFVKFMEAEFARLDKNKSGELDAKELTPIEFAGQPTCAYRPVRSRSRRSEEPVDHLPPGEREHITPADKPLGECMRIARGAGALSPRSEPDRATLQSRPAFVVQSACRRH